MKSLVLMVLATLWTEIGLAQVPISALPAATTSTTGVEVFPVVQSMQTRGMTIAQVQAFLEGANNVWIGTNQFQSISASSATILNFFSSNGLFDNFTLPTQGIHAGSIENVAGQFLEYLGFSIGFNGTNWVTGTDGIGGSNGAALETSSHGIGDWCLRTIASTGGSNQMIAPGALPACAIYIDQNQNITTPGAASVPWAKVAYGSINGISGCVVDTQVANLGISGCTRGSTGTYTVTFNAGFTSAPACTLTAGSGSSGGANANSIASVQSSNSTTLVVDAFNVSLSAQDNHFMITCMGH